MYNIILIIEGVLIMRAFIGIEFSKEAKDKIIEIQSVIRNKSVQGRWKYIDNFHLTLKFLGEVSEAQINKIHDNMYSKFVATGNFTLNAGGISYFKGDRSLRVVFLKIFDKGKKLDSIFKTIEECCIEEGIEKEKRVFSPHITLGQDVILKNGFDEMEREVDSLPAIEIPVRKISIIKSEQNGNKRIYTQVKAVEFI